MCRRATCVHAKQRCWLRARPRQHISRAEFWRIHASSLAGWTHHLLHPVSCSAGECLSRTGSCILIMMACVSGICIYIIPCAVSCWPFSARQSLHTVRISEVICNRQSGASKAFGSASSVVFQRLDELPALFCDGKCHMPACLAQLLARNGAECTACEFPVKTTFCMQMAVTTG